MAGHGKPVSQRKAKKILRDKKVKGKTLSAKQRGMFGLIAGGGTPTRVRDVR